MNRLSLTTLGIGALFISSNCTGPDEEITRPYIILIMTDDQGYETFGCNGGFTEARLSLL